MKRVDAPASRRSHRYPARLLRLSGGSPLAVFILGVLAISAALGSASANLGETEAKINATYGKRVEMPQIAGNQGRLYEKGEFIYDVIFREGVSVFEMYARANQGELSAKEIAAFLKANAAGATWIPAKEKPAGREWKRSDHKAKAAYFRLGGRPTLTVMEAAGIRRKLQAPSSKLQIREPRLRLTHSEGFEGRLVDGGWQAEGRRRNGANGIRDIDGTAAR